MENIGTVPLSPGGVCRTPAVAIVAVRVVVSRHTPLNCRKLSRSHRSAGAMAVGGTGNPVDCASHGHAADPTELAPADPVAPNTVDRVAISGVTLSAVHPAADPPKLDKDN